MGDDREESEEEDPTSSPMDDAPIIEKESDQSDLDVEQISDQLETLRVDNRIAAAQEEDKLGSLSPLPEELILRILSFLDGHNVVRYSHLCREWHRLSDDHALWRYIWFKTFPVEMQKVFFKKRKDHKKKQDWTNKNKYRILYTQVYRGGEAAFLWKRCLLGWINTEWDQVGLIPFIPENNYHNRPDIRQKREEERIAKQRAEEAKRREEEEYHRRLAQLRAREAAAAAANKNSQVV